MSVSVNIIIESKADVLLAPLGAIKSAGADSYAEVLVEGALQKKTVTTGLSNDTMIEIVSGLNEGEQVVTQTINGNSAVNSKNIQSGQQGFGGEFRMLR